MSDKHEKTRRIVEGALDDLKNVNEPEAGKKIKRAIRFDPKDAEMLDARDRDG